MKYKWKTGSKVRGKIDPHEAGKSLEQLRKDQGGQLTAEAVVKHATDPDSVLHNAFEWDDSAAANAHRLEQARYILRSIVVVVRHAESAGPVRAFVIVKIDEDRFYQPIEVVMRTPDLREQLLKRAIAEAEAWQSRYEQFKELSDVFSAIAKAKKAARNKKGKVKK